MPFVPIAAAAALALVAAPASSLSAPAARQDAPLPRPATSPGQQELELAQRLLAELDSYDDLDWKVLARPLFELLIDAGEEPDVRSRVASALVSGAEHLPAEFVEESLLPAARELVRDPRAPDGAQHAMLRLLVQRDGDESLRVLASSEDDSVRARAHRSLQLSSGLPSRDYFRALLESEPDDPNAGYSLWLAIGIDRPGPPVPWVREVKQRLRQQLAEEPDTRTAMALASMIQFELRESSWAWAWATEGSPATRIPFQRRRGDPRENYASLAACLQIAFELSGEESVHREQSGIALAKLRLLQGDWAGMNRMLHRLGQLPLDLDLRPRLHAPPKDWSALAEHWGPADEPVLSGTCGLMLRFEQEDGTGVPGVQVLLKPRAQSTGFASGNQIDTLFHESEPLSGLLDGTSFGYQADWDRRRTRYAVSDRDGRVVFEHLPNTRTELEVLVPGGLSAADGAKFSLWARFGGRLQAIGQGRGAPELGFELKDDTMVACSPLVLRSDRRFDVEAGSAIDPDTFALSWKTDTRDPTATQTLCVLCVIPTPTHWAWERSHVGSDEVVVPADRWSVGERGVGAVRLVPGNAYVFELREEDARGTLLDQVPPTFYWVPWNHRESRSPLEPGDQPPWSDRGSLDIHGVPQDDLAGCRAKLREWLDTHPDAFAREYVEAVDAWFAARAGNTREALEILEGLIQTLPEDCTVHQVARGLTRKIEAGEALPKEFRFAEWT